MKNWLENAVFGVTCLFVIGCSSTSAPSGGDAASDGSRITDGAVLDAPTDSPQTPDGTDGDVGPPISPLMPGDALVVLPNQIDLAVNFAECVSVYIRRANGTEEFVNGRSEVHLVSSDPSVFDRVTEEVRPACESGIALIGKSVGEGLLNASIEVGSERREFSVPVRVLAGTPRIQFSAESVTVALGARQFVYPSGQGSEPRVLSFQNASGVASFRSLDSLLSLEADPALGLERTNAGFWVQANEIGTFSLRIAYGVSSTISDVITVRVVDSASLETVAGGGALWLSTADEPFPSIGTNETLRPGQCVQASLHGLFRDGQDFVYGPAIPNTRFESSDAILDVTEGGLVCANALDGTGGIEACSGELCVTWTLDVISRTLVSLTVQPATVTVNAISSRVFCIPGFEVIARYENDETTDLRNDPSAAINIMMTLTGGSTFFPRPTLQPSGQWCTGQSFDVPSGLLEGFLEVNYRGMRRRTSLSVTFP